MVNSNIIPRSFKELEKEEISTSALCFGKVFIIEDAPFKWWISCNVCKEKFNSLENFLDHTTNIHIKQINKTLKTETEDCWDENTSICGAIGNDTNTVEELSNSENNKIGHEDEHDDKTELTLIKTENKDIDIEDDVDEIISNSEYNEIYTYDNEDSDNSKSTITEIANKNNINAGENKSVLDTKSKLKLISSLPFSNQSFEASVDNEELLYSCPHCDKTYTRKRGLKRHINEHFGLNPLFKCEVCGACLKLKETLKHHMRIHTGEKPFKCDVCSRTFRLRSGFLSHITTHTEQKKFACSFCEKHFRSTLTLQVHERTHTGEKPFQCDKCGNKFVSKGALTTHNNKRHENLTQNTSKTSKKEKKNEKKFKCEICGFPFALKHNLKTHMRVHLKVKTKDYRCRICGDSFVTLGGIDYHMRKIHQCNASVKHNYNKIEPTGEQVFVAKVEKETNFICEFCAASFGNKKCLKQHERIHSKSKDYMCNLCDESFLTYAYIVYHMRTRHQCAPMPNYNYTLKGR